MIYYIKINCYLNEEKYYNTKKYKKQDKNNAKPN